ncbi:MAG: hypothetical protein DMG29_12830 [Acidobacteria bacterium]|nr:MAG: hypothetical protein DMG29_12830 [Acidobacteriota bacterium]
MLAGPADVVNQILSSLQVRLTFRKKGLCHYPATAVDRQHEIVGHGLDWLRRLRGGPLLGRVITGGDFLTLHCGHRR